MTRDLIDRAALVEWMERMAARFEAEADLSDSFLRGYAQAIEDVKFAAAVRLPDSIDDRIARLRADAGAVCQAMNLGIWRGTEAEAVARVQEIMAEIAELEAVK